MFEVHASKKRRTKDGKTEMVLKLVNSFNTPASVPVLTFFDYHNSLTVYAINMIPLNYEAEKSSFVLLHNTLR